MVSEKRLGADFVRAQRWLERKRYIGNRSSSTQNAMEVRAIINSFDVRDQVVICSYQFVSKKQSICNLLLRSWLSSVKFIVSFMEGLQVK